MTTNLNNLKIIVLRSKLLESLNSLQFAVGGDSATLPILRNVLLRAENEKIILITTNLELVVECVLNGKVLEDGVLTLPFSLFHNIVKNLSSERITLEQKDDKVQLITDNYEAVIYSHNAQDYPIIPFLKTQTSILDFNTGAFKDVLLSVLPATQYSDIRPEISGVYVFNANNQVFFVATDSFRLAERFITIENSSNLEVFSFIIPIKTASDVLRILGSDNQKMRVAVDQNQILFETETQKIISRLINGQFPDYKQIIPKDFAYEARINRQEFLNAVKTVSAFSSKANDLTIKTGENNKFLEVHSLESSLGENVYKIPAKIDGGQFSIVFNWRYLLDGLKIYKGEEVILGLNNPEKPAVLKSPTEPFLTYIVMPIKG